MVDALQMYVDNSYWTAVITATKVNIQVVNEIGKLRQLSEDSSHATNLL